ncbi:MAG: flagellar biosynthesis protein FlhA [Deltaproteobacteria bacterium]|nr:flagellar biosynthesis protein FlhA [Deltaproteobacteria bacterium]
MAAAVAGKSTLRAASELAIPIGIITIVLMMVLPVPPLLLDGLLAISLTIAVGVFLIALFIEQALEYSVFPAVILVATLLRLSLNVATTRQILLHGAEGHSAAGRVVETFGQIVVGGNVVVGLVVFFILVIINFVVITKGAGRVAEVAARFTLDAMPGKQMAIDAELNAGLISADVAKTRRRNVEREADFFGAMDGASKFVHGDAVAGLLIAVINLVGGLLIGLSSGMGLSQAAETFSILSIGDALVTQIPSLLVSTASGIVVTRSATGEQLGKALGSQLLGSPRAVGLTAGVLGAFALVPGMPALPFVTLSTVLGYAAWHSHKLQTKVAPQAPAAPAPAPGSAEDIESSMVVDPLALEVGYELISVVDPSMGGTLLDRISVLRRQFALDLGFVMPPVRVRDNLQLQPSKYRFMILGTEIAEATVRPGHVLAMQSSPDAPDLPGEATVDPAFGTRAWWVPLRDREHVEALGYTVVDPTTVLVTHLGEIVRANAYQLLGRGEMQHLFDVFSRSHPKLVDELIPNFLSAGDVLKVLRNLLREGVSIRDLRSILEALLEFSPSTKDTEQLTELTRQRLSRQLTAAYKAKDGAIHALILHPQVDDMFQRSLRDIAAGTGGALDPEETRRLGLAIERAVARQIATGRPPVLVTRPDLRRYIRAFAERRVPTLAVLSFREVEPSVTIRPMETISSAA